MIKRLAQACGAAWLLVACALGGSGSPAPPGATPASSEPASAPTSGAEAAAGGFLDAWSRHDYASMYAALTPLTQDSMSAEEFSARYRDLEREGAFTHVGYEVVSSLVNAQSAQVRYRLTLHSAVVGDLREETWMDLKRVEGEWKIAWSDTDILPELQPGADLFLDVVTPTRANIYDRNGLALATQADVVAVWIVPDQIGDEGALLEALSALFDRRPEAIQARYEPFRETDSPVPVGEISLERFQPYQAALTAAGGAQWTVYSGRYYLEGGVAPHAVGYVGQITQEQLETYQARGYAGDEFVGQAGIEAAFEDELRGKPGGTLYVRGSDGSILAVLASSEAEPPYAVYTSLDRDLQRQARDAIAGFRGAVVVLERDTGAVLAMVSSPDFDPNLFDARNPNSGPGLSQLFGAAQAQPLLDRAVHGLYPLGSVFKVITMSAALEWGGYTPESLYTCNGEFHELPGQTLYDWTVADGLPDHGTITLIQGLERSCNPFFWHIGLDLYNQGLTTALPDMATAYGLGKPTGIETGDSPGLVPDPQWKLQTTGEDWTPGDAVQLAIGQSSLNVTPLQVARYMAAVGNGGALYRPHLVLKVANAEGEVLKAFQPEVQGRLPVSPENIAAIQEALAGVVQEPGGTARHRFLGLEIKVAGKTGTAESGSANPHAWFAGYTFESRPDKPDIAVVVVLDNQGEGSVWAAPVFRRIIEAYFFGRPHTLYPWESQIGVTRTPVPPPATATSPPEATPTP